MYYLIKYYFKKMGGNYSQTEKIKQRHEKFLNVFRNNYKLKEEVNDEIFGSISLYSNQNTANI